MCSGEGEEKKKERKYVIYREKSHYGSLSESNLHCDHESKKKKPKVNKSVHKNGEWFFFFFSF